jgi:tetratricopeptide (TPR) repeat protein
MSAVSSTPEAIFAAAIELRSPVERSRYLDAACDGDAELRRHVGQLVDDHFRAGDFLEAPAAVVAYPATPLAEQPGDLVDRYKLLEELGEGGMGVVFLAEQLHPVVRRVALKIIKPGMDTRQVIGRFSAERQALALMDHPNIAKALDAGTTESGRPYFVMDLVSGTPITEYCDSQRLPLRERLELFIPVCQAVQHAHQKGVIHRDLKPSNVLVAEYDGKPVPKIIDFGVAKAVDERHADSKLSTHEGQLIGTFEYMSPEQASFRGCDVDTRSDVYSLGVLLYELLTRETPFGGDRLKAAPLDEQLRMIREDDPPLPSLHVAADAQQTRSLLAPTHRARELDWIVMKCLEKNRDRRYETASALAADLQHFLANEPVTAAAPSRLYRAAKFVRRNRGGVLAATLVLVGLVAGMIGTSIGLISQLRQRAIAERERAEIQLNYAVALQSQRRYSEAEAIYREELLKPDGGTVADRQRLAITRLRLAETVHDRRGASEAEPFYHTALAAYRAAFPVGDPNIAHALRCVAELHRSQEQFIAAEKLFREAYEIQRRAEPPDHRSIGESAAQLTNVLITLGKYADAEPIARTAIAEHQLAAPKDKWALALARLELGRDLVSMNRFVEAEAEILRAERQLTRLHDFRYGPLALAALYTRWDEAEPGQGYDAKAREWIGRLIGSYVRPDSSSAGKEHQ